MKKVLLAAFSILLVTPASAEMNANCFQAQNAIEIGVANGLGGMTSEFSQMTNAISPVINIAEKYSNYFSLTNPAQTNDEGETLTGSLLDLRGISPFNSNMSWSGEFSVAGKFVLGGNLFVRLSAYIGANLGFTKASVPVVLTQAQVSTNAAVQADPGSISSVDVYSLGRIGQKDVTMKSGLGYGIMLGLGKETSFGSMSIDLGVAFRTFRFYFPSAMAMQTKPGTNVTSQVGFTRLDDTVGQFLANDTNTYGSFYNRYTQAGFRFGGSLSFKLIENLSFGVSVSAEIYGNKTLAINPNISSFTNNPPAATPVVQSTNTTDTSATSSSLKASNIVNTNMMSNAFTTMAKNVVTNVMMTLTYSVPVGN